MPVPGMRSRTAFSRRSRSEARRSASCVCERAASSAAAPKAAMAGTFSVPGRREDGRMLDGGGDDVSGTRGSGRPNRAENGHVVGLGSAAGEDQLGGAGVDEGRELTARGFEALLGALSEMVNARGVTIHLTE